MRYGPFLATFDLTDNQAATIRARLADDRVEVQREGSFIWHLTRNGNTATFYRLGTINNGDTVFYVMMPLAGRTYLRNRLGASRVVELVAAWENPAVRPVLGNLTTRQWLLNHGFGETVATPDFAAGLPVPPVTLCGRPSFGFALGVAG